MNGHWQDVAVGIAVAGAGAYVVRFIWNRLRRSGTGGCAGCPRCRTETPNVGKRTPLVELNDGGGKQRKRPA